MPGAFHRLIDRDNLLDDDGLYGTFVCGLLRGILMLGRYLVDDDRGDIIPHLKNFWAGVTAEPTRRARILNSYLHDKLLFSGVHSLRPRRAHRLSLDQLPHSPPSVNPPPEVFRTSSVICLRNTCTRIIFSCTCANRFAVIVLKEDLVGPFAPTAECPCHRGTGEAT